MKVRHFIIGLMAAFPCFLAAQIINVEPPSKIYTIQCGQFSTQSEADLCELRVRTQKFGPVFQTQPAESQIRVCVGRFETNPEAWSVMHEMSKFGLLNTSIQTMDNSSRNDFRSECASPIQSLLVAPAPKFSTDANFAVRADSSTQPLLDALRQKDRALIISTGAILGEQLPDTDSMKGRVLVETARALVQRDKQSAAAMPYLLKVARGDVAAGQEDFIESRFMMADCWHYYWFAPLKGYRAYKEILDAHGADPGIRARCMVEMAACLLELAQMPDREWRASFDDVRRMCARISHEVPPEFDRAQAVAELMYGETYVFEGDSPKYNDGLVHEKERVALYSKAIEFFTGFSARHPGRIRENGMAANMLAYSYGKSGNWEKCKSIYESILTMDFSDPKENFYWKGEKWSLHEIAAKWLTAFARDQKDSAVAQQYQIKLDSGVYKSTNTAESLGFDFAFPHKFYQTPLPVIPNQNQ